MRRILLLLVLFAAGPPDVFSQRAGDAPALVLRDLGGRPLRLSDYRGRVVLLNFWATWCAPCRAEMPELVAWQKLYAARGLQIVGVAQPPYRRAALRRLARRLKINYPLALGTEGTARLFGAGEILPTTIVIDREGKVRDLIRGILLPEEFAEKVVPLLR